MEILLFLIAKLPTEPGQKLPVLSPTGVTPL